MGGDLDGRPRSVNSFFPESCRVERVLFAKRHHGRKQIQHTTNIQVCTIWSPSSRHLFMVTKVVVMVPEEAGIFL